MTSKYFTIPSFARAKKNKEDLEKTNPQEPVLKDEDEKFLNSHISKDEAAQQGQGAPPTKITDSGEEKEASPEEQEQAGDSVVVPETQPEKEESAQDDETKARDGAQDNEAATVEGAQDDKSAAADSAQDTTPETGDGAQDDEEPADQTNYDDAEKEKAAEAVKARKVKKSKGLDLPSQEEAEAATKGMPAQAEPEEGDKSQGEKRTWSSYLPSVRPGSSSKKAEDTTTTEQQSPTDTDKDKDGRTWKEYATSYVPNLPSIPARFKSSKDKDADTEPIYNDDGTINEEATKERQEREVSVLLDNLNLSSINNRVFAFSDETQKIYGRFSLVLKDIINGAPTAYEDMDKLMKEAGPKLEQQFGQMPPFVQTLVKSLPMKLGSTLGPELLAAASEKPGNDMKARMEAASRPGAAGTDVGGGGGINLSSDPTTAETETNEDGSKKKEKRRIPGFKSLVSSQSGVAGMLRSTVNFLTTRFPFLASGTNVVMSLSVFILMFVFWYCHKRGKEVRLAKEHEAEEGGVGDEEGEMLEVEVSDDEDIEGAKELDEELEKDTPEEEKGVEEQTDVEEGEKQVEGKTDVPEHKDSTEVPLPAAPEQEKSAEMEGEKSVGVSSE